MTIHNNIVLSSGSSSNSVYQLMLQTLLDYQISIRIQLDDNSGDAWGMGLVGDTLMVMLFQWRIP